MTVVMFFKYTQYIENITSNIISVTGKYLQKTIYKILRQDYLLILYMRLTIPIPAGYNMSCKNNLLCPVCFLKNIREVLTLKNFKQDSVKF